MMGPYKKHQLGGDPTHQSCDNFSIKNINEFS